MEFQKALTIDEFIILEDIGEGISGQVYKAINKQGQLFAIKKYQQHITDVNLIKNQFTIIQNLKHESIVKVFDIRFQALFEEKNGKATKCVAIILQYIQGDSLFNFIKDGAFSQKTTKAFFYQILYALDYLHKQKYVHRDIKPHNILLTDNHSIKLIDFGFAKKLQNIDKKLKTQLGSKGYMAPQIYKGEYNGIKTDLFAIGVVLYVMCTASPPFQTANEANHESWYNLIKKEEWTKFWKCKQKRLRKFNLSNQFKQLFEKLVCADPNKRLSIEQIKQHCWLKGQISTAQQIAIEFNQRNKQKQKQAQCEYLIQKQKKLKRERMLNQEDYRSGEDVDKQFLKQYQKCRLNKMKLKEGKVSKNTFIITQQDLSYVIPALKVQLENFQLPLYEDQDIIGESFPCFTAKNIQITASQVYADFECTETIQDEQYEQIQIDYTVRILIQFFLNEEKKISIDIRRQEGDDVYYKKIAKEIKNKFYYCIQ